MVGCGASGMMAAIAAARNGASVTVLDAGRKPGRKLLLTGNGRCNLSNLNPEIVSVYDALGSEGCTQFVSKVFEGFGVQDTLSLFQECGLVTVTEHGEWVYPASGRSDSVLNVLLREMNRLGVKMKYDVEVTGIDRASDGRWQVRTEGWSYACDSVVIACGSRAASATGSNGSGYELCLGLGMDVTEIRPALTALRCRPVQDDCIVFEAGQDKAKEDAPLPVPLGTAAGTRTAAKVSLYADDTLLAQEEGQVQFTQNGVSGIAVFNMSRHAVRALRDRKTPVISLDLLPVMEKEELAAYLQKLQSLRPEDSMKDLLAGILPAGLIPLFASGTDPEKTAGAIKGYALEVTGLRDFENCQICAGGVILDQLDPSSMQCVDPSLEGIHIAGELADVDGPCGGYNLQWAWSSGYVAGMHSAL